ncbi:hypothetical protein Sango_2669100 [Sesamum angolense]|uniref:Reverse transcriptase n=1 Tax=Sesamum angolense TaxID=2727404 RepID=A0AAE1W2B7_9LAMI|nr:hypothetical protein Sango_2669100 [Sesamum angolense]
MMDAYVDDMAVKRIKETDPLAHLAECFEVVREHDMKLNPTKCTFGVKRGKFMGYLVMERGIEENLEKTQALIEMKSARSVEEVQQLTWRNCILRTFLVWVGKSEPTILQNIEENQGL